MKHKTDVIDMQLPETLLTVFSGEIEERGGTPVVTLPKRELDLGELEIGETYRFEVLSQPKPRTDSAGGESPRERPRGHEASDPPVKEGERYEVEIESIGEQGDGIARVGPGYVVFVPDSEVGDRVTVEITKVRENFGFADIVEEEPITG